MVTNISAVIFDLNGVFIKSDVPLSESFEAKHGVDANTFVSALGKVMDVVRKPNAPDTYSLFKPYFDSWGVDVSRDDFYNFWFSAEYPVEEMVGLARKLRSSGVKVFALSNNFRERTDYYGANFPFVSEIFDEVRYSWQTGLVKPDINCWKSILDKYNLSPDTVHYFDDSEKNAKVASSLGIHAHKFEGVEQVNTRLNQEDGKSRFSL